MRKGEGCASVVSTVLIIVVALAIWAYVKYAPPIKHSAAPQTESIAALEPNQSLAQPDPDASAPYVIEPDITDASETDINSSSHPKEVRSTLAPGGLSTEFPLSAHLVDSRGKVVIQSRASVFSKNVTSVATGVHVQASSKEGKWISVQLDDGRVGFVRERQLQFD
jgi:hypothetical protein